MNVLLKTSLVLLCFLFFATMQAQNKSSDKSGNFIAVLYVKMEMNSFIRINCDHFAESFENLLSIQKVMDEDSLQTFLSMIKNIKFEKNNREIDVRRKFIYVSNDAPKNIICSDGRNIMIDGRLIKRDRRLKKFLESMCRY